MTLSRALSLPLAFGVLLAAAACGKLETTPPGLASAGDAGSASDSNALADGAPAMSSKLPNGTYFLAVDLKAPLGAQLQLFADVEVDAATGGVRLLLSNADRNPDGARCKKETCAESFACATIPTERCVPPSEKVGSLDEFPDFVPNAAAPTGYTLLQSGQASESTEGAIAIVTTPKTLVIPSPAVSMEGFELKLTLTRDVGGVWRGTGTTKASNVFVGTNPLGPGAGDASIRSLTPAETPEGLPKLPTK